MIRLRLTRLRHIGLPKVVRQRRAIANGPGLRFRFIGVGSAILTRFVIVMEIFARHFAKGADYGGISFPKARLQIGFNPRERGLPARLNGREGAFRYFRGAARSCHSRDISRAIPGGRLRLERWCKQQTCTSQRERAAG